ncbi:ABC transporter permease [Phototrophicus methaneseepsis]|uniref:ABC transporter permease n=1 Tax=Phototrophicus methaneseepsis TaxID=2710758 RepID=A0A7S8E562_9CHLR|nr:ABC transporter permease [Phototrophicus methaneseepsis]QPC80528.1 ABC transporter permease [Phototrophicus methaneseepsis]
MIAYIIRRTIISIPVLIGITILVFVMANLMPGDALSAMMADDPSTTAEELDIQRERLGLNDPLPVQYIRWLGGVVTGNLGRSLINGESVLQAVATRVLPTVQLMGTALIFAIIVGVVLGVISALKQYSLLDNVLTIVGFAGISMPVFFLGMIFVYIFSLQLDWLPSSGMRTAGEDFNLLDNIQHLILPALSIGLLRSVHFMRYTRSAMLDIMQSDYLRTARAKGLKESRIMTVHALRNALIPIVTVLGLALPTLITGAVFIESVFQWPGMGLLFIRSTTQRDYPMIMGIVLIISIVVLLTNIIVDISYAFVDPRIRYES